MSNIQMVKAISPNGREVTLVASAFRNVYEPRGYVLKDEDPTVDPTPLADAVNDPQPGPVPSEPDVTEPGESEVTAEAPAEADNQLGG